MKTGDFRFHNIEKKELAHIDVCVDGEVIRFIPESLLEKEREKVREETLERILYIGNEIPEGLMNDKRAKFVLLGTPQDFLDKLF